MFPVDAVRAAENEFAGRRLFTSDQWGDYLIYLYYPKLKIFMDGRSDFYGPEMGMEYVALLNSEHRWSEIFDRYDFDLALVPADWPLATTIKMHPHWKLKYDDGKALLLERVGHGPEGASKAYLPERAAAPQSPAKTSPRS